MLLCCYTLMFSRQLSTSTQAYHSLPSTPAPSPGRPHIDPLLKDRNSSASETCTFPLFQSPDLQLFIAWNCFSKTINTTLQISENFTCLELSNTFLSPALLSEILSPTTYFCFHFLLAHFWISKSWSPLELLSCFKLPDCVRLPTYFSYRTPTLNQAG